MGVGLGTGKVGGHGERPMGTDLDSNLGDMDHGALECGELVMGGFGGRERKD